MPIQVNLNKFVQFKFQPDYLQNTKYISTQTDPKVVCKEIGLQATDSNIVLDGGNLIKGKTWIILTNKVFKENPCLSHKQIKAELEKLFDARVIVIPREPYDFTGHADGMLRYYDDNTLLINNYGDSHSASFRAGLKNSLLSQGFKLIEAPYTLDNSNIASATGIYINFLEMRNFLLVPTFARREDETAIEFFENLFPRSAVRTIDASEISNDGGVLNCISWNIAINEIN